MHSFLDSATHQSSNEECQGMQRENLGCKTKMMQKSGKASHILPRFSTFGSGQIHLQLPWTKGSAADEEEETQRL